MRTPLQASEKILLKTNTSWVVLVIPFLAILVAIAIDYFFITSWMYRLILVGIVAIYFYWKYLEWKHNIWVVTNFRVIDEFGVININSKESPLDKINNVSYQQDIWGRIFGYGNVEIQTAASLGETVYQTVDHPRTLKETITNAQANYKHSVMAEQMRSMVAEMQVQPTSTLPLEPSLQEKNTATNNYVAPKPPEKILEDLPPVDATHIATQIEKLISLKQQGVLTEDEYQRAKNRLLGK